MRTLDESIAFRAKFLTDYQNEAYSKRYLAEVERVRAAEAKATPGSHDLTDAFAKGLYKLMAYKDEYEVARLYVETGDFDRSASKEQFDGDVELSSVQPRATAVLGSATHKVTGHLIKQAPVRHLDLPTAYRTRSPRSKCAARHGARHPFGYTAERRDRTGVAIGECSRS